MELLWSRNYLKHVQRGSRGSRGSKVLKFYVMQMKKESEQSNRINVFVHKFKSSQTFNVTLKIRESLKSI